MYKKLIKALLFLVMVTTLVPLFPHNVYADVINPDYLEKKCDPNEVEVVCTYISKEPFGPRTIDGCKKYKKNPKYRFLVGTGSSFGGNEKYCRSAKPTISLKYLINSNGGPILPILIPLIITLIIEITVTLLLGYRDKKTIIWVVLVNIITNPALNLLLWLNSLIALVPTTNLVLILLEIVVVLIEFIILKFALKKEYKTLLKLSLIMNAASFVLGLLLF